MKMMGEERTERCDCEGSWGKILIVAKMLNGHHPFKLPPGGF